MNYNRNAYKAGGVRIEPVPFGRGFVASDELEEMMRMREKIERLTHDVLSKDEIIAVLNDDITRLRRSSESTVVSNLRMELRTKDQAINAIEARHLREIDDLRRRLSSANSNDAATISQLRQRINTLDQDNKDLERRYRGELARKQSRITELEIENERVNRQVRSNFNNQNSATTIADLQAELARTRAELERARGWR